MRRLDSRIRLEDGWYRRRWEAESPVPLKQTQKQPEWSEQFDDLIRFNYFLFFNIFCGGEWQIY